MKRAILVLLVFLFAGSQQLSAKRLSMGKAEQIKVVHELPDTEDYMTDPGRFVDLGILYETFTIGGNIPLWVTKDPVLVGVENHNTDFYLELDKATADELITEHKLNKEQLLHLSLGQICWLGICGFRIAHNIPLKPILRCKRRRYHRSSRR